MVFAIIAIVTTVGYVTFSLNVLDSFNQSVLTRNQMTLDASKEKFDLYNVKIANNQFNVTISNSGNLPINITRMWVQNTTAVDWINYYSINKLVSPGAILTNIGQSSPVYYNSANAYNLKLITGRGNSMQFTIGSPGVKPVYLQAEFVPNSIHTGNNATFHLIVINNMTSSNLLTNLQPNVPSCSGSATATLMGSVVPTQYSYLQSGGIAIFKWVVKVSGSLVGQSATCTVSLKNGISTNTASDTVWIGN